MSRLSGLYWVIHIIIVWIFHVIWTSVKGYKKIILANHINFLGFSSNPKFTHWHSRSNHHIARAPARAITFTRGREKSVPCSILLKNEIFNEDLHMCGKSPLNWLSRSVSHNHDNIYGSKLIWLDFHSYFWPKKWHSRWKTFPRVIYRSMSSLMAKMNEY